MRWLVALGVALHLGLQVLPAWQKVSRNRTGRDYASYHYAVQVAWRGGDPYDTDALAAAAKREGTRAAVHPFFYPPPFVLATSWAKPLSLRDGYRAMFVLNEALLVGCLVVAWRAFAVSPWAIALLLATFTPTPDNATMGQANLLALFPALLGLALAPRRPLAGGALVGLAAMLKMSPALFLAYWALRREWKPVAAAVGAAVVLSLATLPLVGFEAQRRFYLDILPGFSWGDYHGLTVPIGLPANHSIPDLFDRLWPGPNDHHLSDRAHAASLAVAIAALAVWAWRFRSPGDEPAAIAALTVLMVVIPVYTYEHHLVFLLVAVAIAATRGPVWPVLVAYFFLAWPLEWLRAAQKALPADLGPWVRESKFLAEAALFLLLFRRPRG
ncbi:MAG: glycosyltransferase family 87 protein [Myxococcota bacterium]